MSTSDIQDEAQLGGLGYQQEFRREMSLWANFALGFTYLSPVVGVYTLFAFALSTGGPPMIWSFVVVGAGQFLVALVFGEVLSQYPLAGGVYPWARRLWGPKWGWLTGWTYLVALQVAVASVAFGGAPFICTMLGIEPTAGTIVVAGTALVLFITLLNLGGTRLLAVAAIVGFSAELIGAVALGVYLLLTQRMQSPGIVFDSFGVGGNGSYLPAFLAASLTGIYMYLGFEACGDTAEEVRNAPVRVPKAMRLSIYVGGASAMFICFSLLLAVEDIRAVINGTSVDPVSDILNRSFGETGARLVIGVLVLSFVSCALSLQAATSRLLFAFSRDRMIPGSRLLARMSRRSGIPHVATIASSVFPILVLIVSRVSENALTYIVSFAILGFYLAFQMVVLAALRARVKGWEPNGPVTLRGWGTIVNTGALLYGVGAIVNLLWPRAPEANWYENYLLLLSGVIVVGAGVVYMALSRPYALSEAPAGDAISAPGTDPNTTKEVVR